MTYWLEVLSGLLSGMGLSLFLFGITAVLSFPLALVLTFLGRKERPFASRVLSGYTWLFRGTPLMLQLFFFMYGLPAIGVLIPRVAVAVSAFVLNYAAYFVEILRAGVESIDRDQTEAAAMEGAGMGTIYRLVLLPQAIVRQVPVITSELINLIKDTSLVTVIALSDLMRSVKEIVARDFTVSPFLIAAAFYLLVSFFIVRILRRWVREKESRPNPLLE